MSTHGMTITRRLARTTTAALLAFTAATAPATADGEATARPRFEDEVWVIGAKPLLQPVAAGQSVRVRFPVGELEIVADDAPQLATELSIECRRLSAALCAKYRKKLRLEGRLIDNVVEVRLVGLPKWKLRKLSLNGHVRVPRWAPLAVRVGVGEVTIYPGDDDLEVRMGIGDLTITVAEGAVRTVRIATRIGDASLGGKQPVAGHRRLLLGARLDWTAGTGAAQIDVGLKIGDAKVVLE